MACVQCVMYVLYNCAILNYNNQE